MTIMKFVSGDGYSRMFEPPEPEPDEAELAAGREEAAHKTQMRALWALLHNRPCGHALSLDLTRLSPIIGEITPDMLWRAVDEADRLAAWHADMDARMAEQAHARETEAGRAESVVYYIQMATLVKIGVSTNLASRLETIRPQRVLALEPGSYPTETARHHEFQAWRSHGEWFHLSDPLTEHIERVKAEHADLYAPWVDWKPW